MRPERSLGLRGLHLAREAKRTPRVAPLVRRPDTREADVKKTFLPALAAFAAVGLQAAPTAEAHSLYKPGWWKGKTLTEVAERQRNLIAHDRAAIRFFEKRPNIRFVEARPNVRRLTADRIVKWHRAHLRMTKRELGQTLASIRAKRRAAEAAARAAAAAQAAAAASEADSSTTSSSSTSSSSATVSSASTSSAGGYASAATAACESGGDPSAVSPDGRYRGKWQFDQQTWDAHAPSGWQGVDPASAPESVQDQAAGNVPYDAWPNC